MLIRKRRERHEVLLQTAGSAAVVGSLALVYGRSWTEASVGASIALVAGGVRFGREIWRRDFLRRRRARALPVTPTNRLSEGAVVKVLGKVALARTATVVGPVTSQAGVAYEVEVEMQQTGFRRDRVWRPLHQEARAVDFFVDDGAGRALVRVAHIPFHLAAMDGPWASCPFPADSDWEARFETERGGLLEREQSLRYFEAVLAAEHRVAVVGRVRFELIADFAAPTGYRSSAQTPVLTVDTDGFGLVSNDPALVTGD